MRKGPQHQAGSDSLLTGEAFFKMLDMYFEGNIDEKRYCGFIYGLEVVETKNSASDDDIILINSTSSGTSTSNGSSSNGNGNNGNTATGNGSSINSNSTTSASNGNNNTTVNNLASMNSSVSGLIATTISPAVSASS